MNLGLPDWFIAITFPVWGAALLIGGSLIAFAAVIFLCSPLLVAEWLVRLVFERKSK